MILVSSGQKRCESDAGTSAGDIYLSVQEVSAVPEPSTFILLWLGLVGLGCVALRKKYCRKYSPKGWNWQGTDLAEIEGMFYCGAL